MSDNVVSFVSRLPIEVEAQRVQEIQDELLKTQIDEQVKMLEDALVQARAGNFKTLAVIGVFDNGQARNVAWEVWIRPPVAGVMDFYAMSGAFTMLNTLFNEMTVDIFPTLTLSCVPIVPPEDEDDEGDFE